VRAVPAHHSHDRDHDHELGMVNGYVIEHASTVSTERIYWTGDTVWFEAMRDEVAAMGRIDLLMPHLGGVGKDGPWGLYSLDAVEGVQVVRLVDPGHRNPAPPLHVRALRRAHLGLRRPTPCERLSGSVGGPDRRRGLDERAAQGR
jgi:hypothetical protein